MSILLTSVHKSLIELLQALNNNGDEVLITYTGSNFIGQAVVADVEFEDSLISINTYAANNNVFVYVIHSFRPAGLVIEGAIVPPATRSNHLAGHAIDMNIRYNGVLYNSVALSNFDNLPQNVRNFLNAIRNDPGLRWGGDFQDADPIHIDDHLNTDQTAWQARYNATQAAYNSAP